MTHDFLFVHGFSGGRSVQQFMKDLDLVEESLLVPATAEVAKKLSALGAAATKDADKGAWSKVLRAGRTGAALSGRCDERAVLDEAVGKARAWAAAEFAAVVAELQSGGDDRALRERLRKIAKVFKGEPEEALAKSGAKAVVQFVRLRDLDGDAAATAREKAAKAYDRTPWGPLFGARGPELPEDEDEFGEDDLEDFDEDDLDEEADGGDEDDDA